MRNSISKHTKILVWDGEGIPQKGDWRVVLWNDFYTDNEPDYISIPTLVEEQADSIRARYLEWVYQLGETIIKGKRIIDILEIREGFSYWWLTSIAQKFNRNSSSNINDVIKLFVLEDVISEMDVKTVSFASCNSNIEKVVNDLCKKKKIKYNHIILPASQSKDVIKKIYRNLPYIIQVMVYLIRYIYNSIPIINAKYRYKEKNADICFFDALAHLNTEGLSKGIFISNFWTTLVEHLDGLKIKTLWAHTFFKYRDIPDLQCANKIIQQFNNKPYQTHLLIDVNISFKIIYNALIDYCKLYKKSYSIFLFKKKFLPDNSDLNLWLMYKKEFFNSIFGTEALDYCFRLSLYENLFSNMSYKKTGVYLQENSPLEMLLIYSWKTAGHGKLIGAPHTTVSYWDLRYYYDPRTYLNSNKNKLPMPDIVAVNGPYAMNAYLTAGYPKLKLIEVEALRFLDIIKLRSYGFIYKKTKFKLKVLVCLEFLSSTNNKILNWIKFIESNLDNKIEFILKTHPAFPDAFDKNILKNAKFEYASLTKLLKYCDIVFTACSTSAALYAHSLGIPVIQMLDGKLFNASPLRGISSVAYVTTPEELITKISNIQLNNRSNKESYFLLDTEIPMWKNLLDIKN